jgi:glycerol-3-phosphate acyltransferase PlsY
MDLWIALLAGVGGYLLGSVSFARAIVKRVAPTQAIAGMDMAVPGANEVMHVGAISGTAVSMQLGSKWGGITALLDMTKVFVPTLALRLLYPGRAYALIAAGMGLIGHNWPVYHRFRGGRGLSAIYGGFLAIDPIGALVTSLVGMFGSLFILRNVVVSYLAGLWLMIPWIWFRTRDLGHLLYVIAANAIFVLALIPDIRRVLEYRRRGIKRDVAAEMDLIPMGRHIKKMALRLGLLRDGK